MTSRRVLTLGSVFPPCWNDICARYDAICNGLYDQYASKEHADQKEESILWEQIAFELLLTLLLSLKIPFNTCADRVGQVVKTLDGKDKEIDFAITVNNAELYFGVTSFLDSEKDFAKDVEAADIAITGLKRPDGTVSDKAKITSIRPLGPYMNRRLAVRVAKEGKHRLPSDYIYIAFPKIALGFGRGLEAIPEDFSFDDGEYSYPANGIVGLIVVGENLKSEAKHESIERDIWLVKTKVFPHASASARNLLVQIDGITIDMRPKFQEVRRLLATMTKDPRST